MLRRDFLTGLLGIPFLESQADQCRHATPFEQWQAVRVLPVRIIYLEESFLTFKYEDEKMVLTSELFLTNRTIFKEKSDYKKHKWLIYYCEDHRIVHNVEKLKDK
jgi:hypothetical protein